MGVKKHLHFMAYGHFYGYAVAGIILFIGDYHQIMQ
jgi:hypothetical protein